MNNYEKRMKHYGYLLDHYPGAELSVDEDGNERLIIPKKAIDEKEQATESKINSVMGVVAVPVPGEALIDPSKEIEDALTTAVEGVVEDPASEDVISNGKHSTIFSHCTFNGDFNLSKDCVTDGVNGVDFDSDFDTDLEIVEECSHCCGKHIDDIKDEDFDVEFLGDKVTQSTSNDTNPLHTTYELYKVRIKDNYSLILKVKNYERTSKGLKLVSVDFMHI